MHMLDFVRQPIVSAQVSDLVNPAKWVVDAFGGRKTASGAQVSPTTSMTVSQYYACIRAVAEDIGKLPWKVMRAARDPVAGDTLTEDRTSKLWPLLAHWANPELGSQQFREVMLTWALGWGNAYAEIERDDAGDPIALWPIHPTLMRPWRDPETWKLWYRASPFPGFPGGLIEPRDIFHLHGIGPDGLSGWSMAELARQDIGNAIAAQEFEGNIYASGATTRGVLKYPRKLGKGDVPKLRRQWLQTYGNGDTKGAPIVLEGGMEFVSVSVNPRDSMFLESLKQGVVTLARWFRIPPHKIAALEQATLNNVEHLSIEYVTDTILSWATRLEGEAGRKLIPARDLAAGTTTQLDLDALLRGDFKTRADGTRTLVSTAVLTPNEGRRIHGLNPSKQKGADSLWVQGAMRRIDDPSPFAAPGAGPGPGAVDPAAPDGGPDAADPAADPSQPGGPQGDPVGGPDVAPAAQTSAVPPRTTGQALRDVRTRALAARQAAGAKAADATRPVFLDAGDRIARRHEKALARLATKHHADGEAFQAEVKAFLAAERPTLLEVLAPAARTFLATAVALEAPGVDRIGGGAVVEAFVDRYLAAASSAAWARYREGKTYDAEAEGRQVAVGMLHQLDVTLAAA